MGQKYGKYQATPLTPYPRYPSYYANANKPTSPNKSTIDSTNQQPSTDLATSSHPNPTQTGNIIITIRMLTMNSNEVNRNNHNNTATSTSGISTTSNNIPIISMESSSTPEQIVDQSQNNQTTNNNNNNNNKTSSSTSSSSSSTVASGGSNDVSSVCKKYNSKYNQATLVQHQQQQQQQQQPPPPVAFDSQNNVNSTSNNSSIASNFRLSSCPFADKISNMLANKCKLNSSSSSNNSSCSNGSSNDAVLSSSTTATTTTTLSSEVPSNSKTSRVKKGILGKFKSAKQKKNKDDQKYSSDEANSSLNTSSSSTGSKTDTCTCTASHRLDESIINQSSGSCRTFTTDHPAMGIAYGSSNPLLIPASTSISITNGTSSTSGSGATAIVLPDTLSNVVTNSTATFIHSGGFPSTTALYGSLCNGTSGGNFILVSPFIEMARLSPDDSLEDCDEAARLRRAIQIAEGVEAPPGFVPSSSSSNSNINNNNNSTNNNNNNNGGANSQTNTMQSAVTSPLTTPQWQTVFCSQDTLQSLVGLRNRTVMLQPTGFLGDDFPLKVHSQADYIHCLVPDLQKITSSCFYWGKMDRYEAEKLLDGKPEGTFLLRDSAQEEFLFSVSFRKYGRSLHARIEQFNHEFSFDSHDPGVYTARTVTGLLEHYKDPACVMFFEPMLTLPLHRNFVFSLQELTRAAIVSNTSYDGIDKLCVPKMLKSYLKEYHYKQRVHVKRLDDYQDS